MNQQPPAAGEEWGQAKSQAEEGGALGGREECKMKKLSRPKEYKINKKNPMKSKNSNLNKQSQNKEKLNIVNTLPKLNQYCAPTLKTSGGFSCRICKSKFGSPGALQSHYKECQKYIKE
jgi:hypothetical protein